MMSFRIMLSSAIDKCNDSKPCSILVKEASSRAYGMALLIRYKLANGTVTLRHKPRGRTNLYMIQESFPMHV
jgi:hypothetical protein